NPANTTAGAAADGNPATFWQADSNKNLPWIEFDLGKETSISRAVLFEGREEGQRNAIRIAQLQVLKDTGWHTVKEISAWGFGSEKFDEWPLSVSVPEIRFDPIVARKVRFTIIRATRAPAIHELE